ncbi:Coiled-coil domain-containing protein [Melia azedarach]|uniref:Coiled-coil domain-containing protein n=1 Tax=Melia azedarach TaxID=155640 RepID=A0ACC1Z5D0_MELAZ|nr:Coiled-coil domain-containing protein [Melia azedarach]
MASSLAKRLDTLNPWLRAATRQLRFARTESGPSRRRSKSPVFSLTKTTKEKSEWWTVDGEMHEIGDHVPPRERFVIPRDNIPNKRRKQLREQFMRRTRLVVKESEHEVWCKRYMELYQELRENWERLYWDEGYSKKIAEDHANYDSAEEDDQDFNPHRSSRRSHGDQMRDQGFWRDSQGDTWEKVNQIRDKFEYDRERRMREKAFAPINGAANSDSQDSYSRSPNQPFDTQRYFAQAERN